MLFLVTRVAGSAPDFAFGFAVGAFGCTFFFSATLVTSSGLPAVGRSMPPGEAKGV